MLSETWFSANTCRDVLGYAGFHTYRADKSGGGVFVFVRDCYTSIHVANFSVCHAYYVFSVVRILVSNNCTVIIIGVYYFQRKFTECSNNCRDAWKTLISLIRCKKTSTDVTLNHNGSSISDPSAIAEIFNDYFSNIATNLDSDIPRSNISPLYFLGAPVEN